MYRDSERCRSWSLTIWLRWEYRRAEGCIGELFDDPVGALVGLSDLDGGLTCEQSLGASEIPVDQVLGLEDHSGPLSYSLLWSCGHAVASRGSGRALQAKTASFGGEGKFATSKIPPLSRIDALAAAFGRYIGAIQTTQLEADLSHHRTRFWRRRGGGISASPHLLASSASTSSIP